MNTSQASSRFIRYAFGASAPRGCAIAALSAGFIAGCAVETGGGGVGHAEQALAPLAASDVSSANDRSRRRTLGPVEETASPRALSERVLELESLRAARTLELERLTTESEALIAGAIKAAGRTTPRGFGLGLFAGVLASVALFIVFFVCVDSRIGGE